MTDRSKRGKRQQGKAMAAVMVLLLLIVGGGYNYHRNLQSEAAEQGPRPFKGYATDDLSSLRDAYDQEVRAYERKHSAQQRQRVRASGGGVMDEQVDQFERIQRNSAALRETTADVAERQAQLRAIERELELRSALAGSFSIHLRRLTKI
jgi:hypothetical protein